MWLFSLSATRVSANVAWAATTMLFGAATANARRSAVALGILSLLGLAFAAALLYPLLVATSYRARQAVVRRRQARAGAGSYTAADYAYDQATMQSDQAALLAAGIAVATGVGIVPVALSSLNAGATVLSGLLSVAVVSGILAGSLLIVFQFSDSVFPAIQEFERGFIRPLLDGVLLPLLALVVAGWQLYYGATLLAARLVSAVTTLPIKLVIAVLFDDLPSLFVDTMNAAYTLVMALGFWLQNGIFTTTIPLSTPIRNVLTIVANLWRKLAGVLLKAATYVLDGPFLALQEPSLPFALNAFISLFYVAPLSLVVVPIIQQTRPSIAPTAAAVTVTLTETARYLQNTTTYGLNTIIFGNETTLIAYVNGSLPVPPGDDIIYLVRFLRSNWAETAAYVLLTFLGIGFQIADTAFKIDIVFSSDGDSVFTFDYIREPALAAVASAVSIFTVLPTCNTNPPTFTNVNFGGVLNVLRAIIYLLQGILSCLIGEFYSLVNNPLNALGVFTANYIQTPGNAIALYGNELQSASTAIGCIIGLVDPAIGNAVAGFLTTLAYSAPEVVLQILTYVRQALQNPQTAYVFFTLDLSKLEASLSQVGKIGEIFYALEPGANPTTCQTQTTFFCALGSGLSRLATALISLFILSLRSILALLGNSILVFSGAGTAQEFKPAYGPVTDAAYDGTCRLGVALGTLVPFPLACHQSTAPNLCAVREYPSVVGEVDNCLGTTLCKFAYFLAIPLDVYATLINLFTAFPFIWNTNFVVASVQNILNIVIFRAASFVCPLAHFFDCIINAFLQTPPEPVVSNLICLIMAGIVFIYVRLSDTLIKIVNIVLQIFVFVFTGGGSDPARTLVDIILGLFEILLISAGQLILALLQLALFAFYNVLLALCYGLSIFTLFLLVPLCEELRKAIQFQLGAGLGLLLNDPALINYKRWTDEELDQNAKDELVIEAIAYGKAHDYIKMVEVPRYRRAVQEKPPNRCWQLYFDIQAQAQYLETFYKEHLKFESWGLIGMDWELNKLLPRLEKRGRDIRSSYANTIPFGDILWTATEGGAPETEQQRQPRAPNTPHPNSPAARRERREKILEPMQDADTATYASVFPERHKELMELNRARKFAAAASFSHMQEQCPNDLEDMGFVIGDTSPAATKRYVRAVTEGADTASGDNSTIGTRMYSAFAGYRMIAFGPGPRAVNMTDEQMPLYMHRYVYWEKSSKCYMLFSEAANRTWSSLSPADHVYALECMQQKFMAIALARQFPVIAGFLPEDIFYNPLVRVPAMAVSTLQFSRVALHWFSDRVVPYARLFDQDYQRQWNISGLSVSHYAAWQELYPGPDLPAPRYIALLNAVQSRTLTDALKANYPELYNAAAAQNMTADPLTSPIELLYGFATSFMLDSLNVVYRDAARDDIRKEWEMYGSPYPADFRVTNPADNITDYMEIEYDEVSMRRELSRAMQIDLFASLSAFIAGGIELLQLARQMLYGSGPSSIVSNFKRAYTELGKVQLPPVRDLLPTVVRGFQGVYGNIMDEMLSGASRKATFASGAALDGAPEAVFTKLRAAGRRTVDVERSGGLVRAMAYGAHSIGELISYYGNLTRAEIPPACIHAVAASENTTYDMALELIRNDTTGSWQLRCADRQWKNAMLGITRTSPELGHIINDPVGFVSRIFAPRTPSAETNQQRVRESFTQGYALAQNVFGVFWGDTDAGQEVIDAYFGQGLPSTSAVAAAAMDSPSRATRLWSRATSVISRASARPAIGARSRGVLGASPSAFVGVYDAEADFADYMRTSSATRDMQHQRQSVSRVLFYATDSDRRAAMRDAQQVSVSRAWLNAHSRLRASQKSAAHSYIERSMQARAGPSFAAQAQVAARDTMGDDAAELVDIIRQITSRAREARDVIGDLERLRNRGWVAARTRPSVFDEARVNIQLDSARFRRDEEAVVFVRADSREGALLFGTQGVVPINITDFFTLECPIAEPVLCEYFLAPTIIVFAGFTSTAYVISYYAEDAPVLLAPLLAFVPYSANADSIVVSGSGANPPWIFSAQFGTASYYQLWPDEIQNGVDFFKWLAEITGPAPPPVINGTYFTLVSEYIAARDAARASGSDDVPENTGYEFLAFIQFTLGIDILGFADTYIAALSSRVSFIVANIADRTAFCTYTSEIDCSRQNYSFAAGVLVTFVWTAGAAFAASLVLQYFGIGLITILLIISPFAIPGFMIITYNWSLRCIVPPQCVATQAFQFGVFSVAPKCNGIIGAAVTSTEYSAANCYDPALSWEFVSCPSVSPTVYDALAAGEKFFGIPSSFVQSATAFFELLYGSENVRPVIDWDAVDISTDEALSRTTQLCTLIGLGYNGAAAVFFAVPAASATVVLLSFVARLAAPLFVVLAALANVAHRFATEFYTALELAADDDDADDDGDDDDDNDGGDGAPYKQEFLPGPAAAAAHALSKNKNV